MSKGDLSDRRYCPVFVTGCHRSGTNLLYDVLMSAGGFAFYRGFLPVYETLIPHFGSLENRRNRARLLDIWLQSESFRRTGLDREALSQRILNECKSGGDFFQIVMGSIAQSQGAQRWVVYGPDNVLHMERIKAIIPNALFLHIIRDGRDIALSLKKMGGFTPFPWDRFETSWLVATALYWEWTVRTGRKQGSHFPADYMEVHYEDLVLKPREVLAAMGRFLDHDFDYDRILNAGLGRLSESNSSFRDEAASEPLKPVERWKERLSEKDVAAIEAAVGNCLEESGYSLSLPEAERRPGLREWSKRALYRNYLDAKVWLKLNTPAGHLAGLANIGLDNRLGTLINESDSPQ